MTDSTGHFNHPNAGPYSVQIRPDIPYYLQPNPRTGRIELIEIAPDNEQDEIIMDFPDKVSAQMWVNNEVNAGRLKRT